MFRKSNICIVLLVGIPGSGKSCFMSFLENYCKVNPTTLVGPVEVFPICYDDYCNVRNPRQFNDSGKWKDKRRIVLKEVENLILHIKGENTCNSQHISHVLSFLLNKSFNVSNTSLVVIDDNMYYRSMRFEYFKIAKTYSLSFCQLFFHVSLDEAFKFNKKRRLASQVPEDIIISMFHKIEPPNQCHLWERNYLWINGHVDFNEKSLLSDLFTLIKNALSNPLVKSEQMLDITAAQKTTNCNTIHQIDNILKQLVGTLITKQVEGKDTYNAQSVSKDYSKKRLSLLKKIKTGIVFLPIDLAEPFNYNALNTIKLTLLELLELE